MSDNKTVQSPKVGVVAILISDGKVLLGKRKQRLAQGTWAPPGGHLEFREEIDACAIREVKEETGIEIKNVRFGTLTNNFFAETDEHFVVPVMVAECDAAHAKNIEPENFESWGWFEWNDLPKPLFLCLENALKNNFSPFESQKQTKTPKLASLMKVFSKR